MKIKQKRRCEKLLEQFRIFTVDAGPNIFFGQVVFMFSCIKSKIKMIFFLLFKTNLNVSSNDEDTLRVWFILFFAISFRRSIETDTKGDFVTCPEWKQEQQTKTI